MNSNDVKLINSSIDGDDTAFTELVKKYQKQVHALVWRKIGDFHIAEEITQDTFLYAYQKLTTLKKPQQFTSWLYVIATNLCSSWLRKQHLRKQLLQDKDTIHREKSTYSEYVREENERITAQTQQEVVQKLLAKLNESERTVVTLHYFGDMSCKEIGAFLGVSANTVKSRLRRAQQRLQKEEWIIMEALDNFQISPILTENIMSEISRTKVSTPNSGKPLIPWAFVASTIAVVLLILGFGNHRNLAHVRQPYSLDATAEMSVEIVDTPIVADLESKTVIQSQVRSVNVQNENNNPKQQPDVAAVIAETQTDEISEDYTKWELPKSAKARLGKGGINVMQFSPDGTLLAIGSSIGVWLYDVKTGKEISIFPGSCQSLAFSPDGRFLANGGGGVSGQELQLWDLGTAKKIVLTGLLSPASELYISKDGKTLISLGNNGDTIGRLDMATKERNVDKIKGRWKKHRIKYGIEPYDLTNDLFAIGMIDGNIELWDTNLGIKLSTLNGHWGEHVLDLEFSPDGAMRQVGAKIEQYDYGILLQMMKYLYFKNTPVGLLY
ncbi:sigma-70 family RNA polymerase sigma factor [Candidatus Poribacteria bacterium]|nr:sigma-70 family RNA polymerase sigma factor [Candidatus Poribacteria bacterium]